MSSSVWGENIRTSRGVKPPKQARSLATFHRILDATEDMLRSRRFDDISINDLCAEAMVSTSSLYARFPQKEAILHSVFDRYVERAKGSVAQALEEVEMGFQDPFDLIKHIVTKFLDFSRANADMLLVMSSDHRLFDRRWEIDETVTATARDIVAHRFGFSDARTLFALEFSARSASAIAARALGPPTYWANTMRINDERLANELTKMILGYLNFDDMFDVAAKVTHLGAA